MKLSDFDFELPDGLIATRPASPRSSSRLLVVEGDRLMDAVFADIGRWLRPGDRLVLNDTKVLPARIAGTRVRETADGSGRARVEMTLVGPAPGGGWRVLAKPLRRLREGDRIELSGGHEATVEGRDDAEATIRFACTDEDLHAVLHVVGEMPLPPYIAAKRPPDARDRDDYQTVWARHEGAVAAPTASLHFDRPLLERLRAQGVAFTEVTLHVGAGTFLPVKVEDVETHRMHAEWGNVDVQAAEAINATRAAGGRLIPVGTTALRLIESAARGGSGRVEPFRGETEIFIRPGFEFRATDGLITNFHLPQSTLLMLVSALMGRERMLDAYAHAIREGYRFFSYGDGSLLLP